MKPPKSHAPGIYKIVCTKTGKFYLGSSNNCYKRWSTHWSALRANRHQNRHLQFAFNKYGKDAFEFQVVEEVEVTNLLIREQEYLDSSTKDQLLNCSFRANATMLGKQHSEEAKAKTAMRSKGKNNPMYGKKHKKESLKKMCGEKNHIAKLCSLDVQLIRAGARYLQFKDLARIFNVSPSTIADIVHKRTWIDAGSED